MKSIDIHNYYKNRNKILFLTNMGHADLYARIHFDIYFKKVWFFISL